MIKRKKQQLFSFEEKLNNFESEFNLLEQMNIFKNDEEIFNLESEETDKGLLEKLQNSNE